jgi:3'-phosphoadenosine 5'-phosphosulfate sulfotransferase (PAPS reductase)/FAD synthetase
MEVVRRYLSFGGGVNSTALLLLMADEGMEFETVFVNHGGDYPETYAYVELLRERGYIAGRRRPFEPVRLLAC